MSHRRLVLSTFELSICYFSLPHSLSCIPGPSPHTPSPRSQTRAYLPQYRARLRTASTAASSWTVIISMKGSFA
ncbi:hypothetical protein B0H14DRAFT_2679438 [Mycena olivaceomarginata]|nr:hypothetical protein B0H14DRAFT_2679438 [Mycena olivaceomarginata]